jgi:pimeloyl-ACP methyl ester carboxylesterase
MTLPVLPGILAKTIETRRLATRVLFSGPEDGIPVLFLHGNTSCATWWEKVLLTLPAGFLGIAPDQRGFGEADPKKKIDATRGMGDLADDAIALLNTLGFATAHIVGNSLGGSVTWRILADYAQRVRSLVLIAPGSPYGFGGTKDVEGTPCHADFAGSGGGLANAELLRRLQAGDRSLESPFSPRMVLRTLIVKPPYIADWEDNLVEGMLGMHIGPEDNPGGVERSPNWPYAAPGRWGPANALSPKYTSDAQRIIHARPKPHILWMRGENDLLVSDKAASDPAVAGMMGLIPGWPGEEIYPPQPMLKQTRDVLEKYKDAGGSYHEHILRDTAHVPYIENLTGFNRIFHLHLQQQESRKF